MNITTRPLNTDELVTLISRIRPPWKNIYYLAVFTGLRISDLLAFPWTESPTFTEIIEIKTGKTKRLSWSPLSLDHWLSLYKYGEKRQFLFPFRDPSTYRKKIQYHFQWLKLNTDRVAFHSLRKSHAVLAYRTGGMLSAKSAMNHSSISTTETYIETALLFDTYAHFDSIFR